MSGYELLIWRSMSFLSFPPFPRFSPAHDIYYGIKILHLNFMAYSLGLHKYCIEVARDKLIYKIWRSIR